MSLSSQQKKLDARLKSKHMRRQNSEYIVPKTAFRSHPHEKSKALYKRTQAHPRSGKMAGAV